MTRLSHAVRVLRVEDVDDLASVASEVARGPVRIVATRELYDAVDLVLRKVEAVVLAVAREGDSVAVTASLPEHAVPVQISDYASDRLADPAVLAGVLRASEPLRTARITRPAVLVALLGGECRSDDRFKLVLAYPLTMPGRALLLCGEGAVLAAVMKTPEVLEIGVKALRRVFHSIPLDATVLSTPLDVAGELGLGAVEWA